MANRNSKKNKDFRRDKLKEHPSVLPPGVLPKIFAIFCWIGALIFSLSFFQLAGIGGEYLLKGMKFLVGKTIYCLPLIFILAGFFIFKTKYRHYFLPSLLAILLLVLGTAGILTLQNKEEHLGGILGYILSWPLLKLFGFWVSQIIFLAVILTGCIIFWHLFWQRPEKKISTSVSLSQEKISEVNEERPEIRRPLAEKGLFVRIKKIKPAIIRPKIAESEIRAKKEEITEIKEAKFLPYPLDLLEPEKGKPNSGDINKNSAIIKNTLENFEIPVEMAEVNVGPTVTQYTLKPAEGIKLSKITALNNNLALALASHPIRIEAPIPGRPLVGIEVPNKERAEVRLRNLLERPEVQESSSSLLFVLGRDVAGNPLFADLAKMPHLLVAGATGTGKTIFLNSLILNLLYRNSPETLRFILADPKRVEFSVYQELPYLLGPVIFEAEKTVLTLRWLTGEMEKRFRMLSEAGARDIISYNKIVAKTQNSPSKIFSKNLEGQNFREENLKVMPYIILIIDELADLMAAKGREIEGGIIRLAQLARAVGIHLVVATQRPSVEVLTGLIKANITSRITFQVATQVDSRTVLDMAGAEKLLGSGDMLFLSAQTPKPKRIQAAFVADREVRKVVNWLRNREEYFIYNSLSSSLAEAQNEEIERGEMRIGEFTLSEKTDDVLYGQAKRIVIEARKASASLLQRRLSIGYARAARLLDILEQRGIVGPAEGAKPRQVYGEKNI